MTGLDDAVKAAMDGECVREVVPAVPLYLSQKPGEYVICAAHACGWRDDEPIPCDEHRKIAAAVRAGWAAAINAVSENRDLAREDVPALLREIDRLRGLLDGMTDECGAQWRTQDDYIVRHPGLTPENFQASYGPHWRLVRRRVTEWQEVQP